ncbi:MAG: DUF456 domain-containing protein [Paludibacteraceae bacterium]|jgi:uncharacterized protein YqgC (DUF456 family)|nr:DUF456 domain-containing protein [Paludibacteraceae bacterium]
MDIFLIILSVLLLVAGLAGSVLPFPPGPPFSFLGFWLASFTTYGSGFSATHILIALAAMVIIEILDYTIPAWATKKFGGSKKGVWGSIIGMIVGIFFTPIGMIMGMFIGAFIGEKLDGKELAPALKSAFGSFVGFVCSTAIKLIYGIATLWLVLKPIVSGGFDFVKNIF